MEKNQQVLLEFQLDLNLINHLRTFKHKDHRFEPGFLETIHVLLEYYQNHPQKDQFLKFIEKVEAQVSVSRHYAERNTRIGIDEIVLFIHFRFATMGNIDELLEKVGNKTKLENLNQKNVRSTNIFNLHAILDLKPTLDKTLLDKIKNQIKPQYLEKFTISITDIEQKDFDKNKNTVFLCYEYLALGIKSKGKLSTNITSYVVQKINPHLGTHLYHSIFAFAYNSDPKLDQTPIYTENFAKNLHGIVANYNKLAFNKDQFKKYRDELVKYRKLDKYDQKSLDTLLDNIESQVSAFIIARSHRIQHFLEKLLIGMLGHTLEQVRDKAIILLNVIYDGVDWQKRAPFHCKISKVGSKFLINYLIESEKDDDFIILLKSYLFIPECKQNVISLHKPECQEYKKVNGRRFVQLKLDFGTFTRCGFYDWKLVRLQKDGSIKSVYKIADLTITKYKEEGGEDSDNENTETQAKEIVTKPVQGRFIVHPRNAQDLQIHEVFIDQQDGIIDDQGKILRRGNFKRVAEALDSYHQTGINCIYLMGALERDNGVHLDKFSHQPHFKRPDVSPLAITSRSTPNSMLGGKPAFKQLCKKAKEVNMQLMVDVLTRISSARMHQKYRKHILHTLDEQGKNITVFGTDGRAVSYEDTALLNYRKKKCWDLFLQEITEFVDEYGLGGVHLDNGQAWPQILVLDEDEMYRREVDGQPAYTTKQIFEGEIVEVDENSGYYGSKLADAFPNPFLVKLCRRLWMNHPEFLIVSEVWGKMGGFDGREYSVIQSGPIPRLFKLPIAICQFFGQELKKDGNLISIPRKPVHAFKRWYEAVQNALPEGAIVVQSTTYHTWPYPGMLYKRGAWAACDLVFFMPDIPMTFIGEIEGKATKVKATNFFASVKFEQEMIEQDEEESEEEEGTKEEKEKKDDVIEFTQKFASQNLKVKRLMLMQTDNQFFDSQVTEGLQGYGFNLYEKVDSLGGGSAIKRKNSGFIKMTSTQTQSSQEEKQIVASEGYDFIEALKNISKHYQHRRSLRQLHKPLRKGRFVSLLAEHMYGWHTHVLAFARYTKKQMAIIAINFNNGFVDGHINLKALANLFPDYQHSDVVVEVLNWMQPEKTVNEKNHYFIGEFLQDRLIFHLEGFQTLMYGIEIHQNNPEKIKRAQTDSLLRLTDLLLAKNPQEIFWNDTAHYLFHLSSNCKSFKDFINGFSWAYKQYYKDFDMNQLTSLYRPFKDDYFTKNKLFAFFNLIANSEEPFVKKQEFYNPVKKILDQNKLGPIVCATPEYGKWTKTGGLGVMTDELCRGLVELGEEVYVITPWYEIKNKANPKMLEKDGILFERNLEVWVAKEKYTVGIYYGKQKAANNTFVHLYFIHEPTLFYAPFEGDSASYILKGMALYTRCVLQIMCDIKKIPELIINNDWFTGLIGAYIKSKKFGNVFDGTKTYHIAHNLDPSYEGRLYPNESEGSLGYIHELPDDWLVDPFWKDKCVNPSRCAFMNCSNWGTVSHSYKYQLLRESPLSPILSWYPNAFSHPNGLNKEERFQMIVEKTGNDHLKSKEIIQKKYFGMDALDDSIPLYGFVGRITEQKGIHLITDSAEEIIQRTKGKIQILIGGNHNHKEPYANAVGDAILKLRAKYPKNFWGDPDLFFTDGPNVNCGCDFGLMPSKFEPGGIVQQEFFVGSTPVIAHKTGGLQDTVHEFNFKTLKGSGFVFEPHTKEPFVAAMERSFKLYKNPAAYKQARENSFNVVIDVSDVSRAYIIEFYRMFGKNFIDKPIMNKFISQIDTKLKETDYQPIIVSQKKKGIVVTNETFTKNMWEKVLKEAEASDIRAIVFKYKPSKGVFPRSVALVGTFDNWKKKSPLKYDQFSREWKITIGLNIGEYYYKFVVDDDWVCNDDDPKDTDMYGNLNNIIRVE